ncbi:MAG: hypothetical protein ABWX74_16610 [Aeromicrobium sp.]
MSARPGEWHLLDHDDDPVPGDADDVGDEATHYSTVARTISAQAARLRRLAESDDDLVGQYADELRDGMRDLADDLDKIHGRFEVVGTQLALLEPALRTARRLTGAALADAVEAQKAIDANAPSDVPPDPTAEPPTQAEKDAATDRDTRHTAGVTALSDAKTACDGAMGDFDEVADAVAKKIKDASDDDMKDGRWDKFKGFIAKIAPVLKFIAKVLSYAALVLAFFVAPWIIVVLIAGSLLINTLLAATDNGSWVDVAFDVVGLLTLGIGSKALAIARAGRATTLARAAGPAARTARAEAFAARAWNGGRGVRGALSHLRPSVRSAMRVAHADELARVRNLPLADGASGLKSLVRGGFDPKLAGMVDDLRGIRTAFPDVNVAIRHSAGVAAAQHSAAVNVAASATQATGDLIDLGRFAYSKVR